MSTKKVDLATYGLVRPIDLENNTIKLKICMKMKPYKICIKNFMSFDADFVRLYLE